MATVAIMVAALMTTTGAGQASASACHPFRDVDGSNAHCANIEWFAGTDVTNGYSGGKFRPHAAVSRGAMAAFLFRLSHPGKADPTCTGAPFPDVQAGNPLCGAIEWLEGSGITNGYSDGTFHPGASISRGAMSAFVYRFAGPNRPATKCAAPPFDDVPADSAFCGTTSWLVYHGITHGLGSGAKYGPAKPMSRAATATFLHRVSNSSNLGAMPRGYAAFDAMFVRLVNHARSKHGMATVRPAKALNGIAMSWSSHMANGGTGGKLAHNPDYFNEVAAAAPSWTTAGENVAKFSAGRASPNQVMKAYMGSPGHRANILNSDYRYIGLRTAKGGGSAFNTMGFADSVA